MAINNIEQPNIININESLRLIKYNGNYEIALRGYKTHMYIKIQKVYLMIIKSQI